MKFYNLFLILPLFLIQQNLNAQVPCEFEAYTDGCFACFVATNHSPGDLHTWSFGDGTPRVTTDDKTVCHWYDSSASYYVRHSQSGDICGQFVSITYCGSNYQGTDDNAVNIPKNDNSSLPEESCSTTVYNAECIDSEISEADIK